MTDAIVFGLKFQVFVSFSCERVKKIGEMLDWFYIGNYL